MKIYNHQIKELSVSIRKTFIKSANVILREKLPSQTINFNDETLNQKIDRGITKATKYNIYLKDDVIRFIEFILNLGEDFELNPLNSKIKKILLTSTFSGTEKLNRIEKLNLNKIVKNEQ